jgi:formylmethanofuran:tetrahydromethanopterin formyltransferase
MANQLLEGSPTTNLIRITTHIDQHISIKVKLDSGSYGDTYTYIDRTLGRTVRTVFLHNLEFVRHDANNREVAAEHCVDAFLLK